MLSDVTMFSSHVVQIRVLEPPLVAIVDGGDGILISHTSVLKLNSSRSLGLGGEDAVTFSWKCYTEQEGSPEILIGECRDRQHNNLIALAKSPVLNIPGGTLAPSSILTYNFELTLSQIGRAPAKSTMFVRVSNNSFPTVTTSFVARYDISGTAKMNDDDRLMMQGLSDALSTAFVWSAEKLQGAPRGVTPLGLTNAPLVILANAVQPDTLIQEHSLL